MQMVVVRSCLDTATPDFEADGVSTLKYRYYIRLNVRLPGSGVNALVEQPSSEAPWKMRWQNDCLRSADILSPFLSISTVPGMILSTRKCKINRFDHTQKTISKETPQEPKNPKLGPST